eukprot:TRINITY_DN7511_c0_g1_i1.p1 TRINITY_DN7511_c0_g1~~TRINITY_DN7511_c0_g1_i1.p1  ORF type:complete len:102 (+),score=14.56 TRINITY_DN7511_c0_g1_i1:257-562(+)
MFLILSGDSKQPETELAPIVTDSCILQLPVPTSTLEPKTCLQEIEQLTRNLENLDTMLQNMLCSQATLADWLGHLADNKVDVDHPMVEPVLEPLSSCRRFS